ncbi:unnamed protein product [Cuscuta europaea]|uniref:Uncharacterized protein n=1 Tax=Cuscuta europaea TaxID=41803 RepID=A0A9P1E4F2_CUSEU|nr:unnamed protein product [Cuscuta europaea]
MRHLHYFQPTPGAPWRCVDNFHRVVVEVNEEDMIGGEEGQGEEHQEEEAHAPPHGGPYDMEYLTAQIGQIPTELAVHKRDLRDQRCAIQGMGGNLWSMNHYCQELGWHFKFQPTATTTL